MGGLENCSKRLHIKRIAAVTMTFDMTSHFFSLSNFHNIFSIIEMPMQLEHVGIWSRMFVRCTVCSLFSIQYLMIIVNLYTKVDFSNKKKLLKHPNKHLNCAHSNLKNCIHYDLDRFCSQRLHIYRISCFMCDDLYSCDYHGTMKR